MKSPIRISKALQFSRPPLERMMRLHQRLVAGDFPNCRKLSDELEVSTKTIQRDIDFMRDRLGLPIEYDQLHFGFVYTEPVIGEVFQQFCDNLKVTTGATISYRYQRITRQLNTDFYGYANDTYHSIYTGSYGRDTAIEGFSDHDMLFWLRPEDYKRFDSYVGNGQSAMLQEVRTSIKKTYPNTEASGDGQVVVVKFDDGMRFEIAPGFELTDNRFKCPNSNAGGTWYITDPRAEQAAINKKNEEWNRNLKRLARMARAWKRTWAVPIGGLLVDTLAHNFLGSWQYRDKSYIYYDWMSRDFFSYLMNQVPTQAYWLAPGSNQYVWRKGDFEYKAKRCYNISLEAIEADGKGYEHTRNQKWRDIYGTNFPS